MKIFIASPLGFAESSRDFIHKIIQRLQRSGYDAIDPWSSSDDLQNKLQQADRIVDPTKQKEELHRVSMLIAARNSQLLRSSDGVLAVLDGVDVDSGTASEIGYSFGLGKRINGYRGDFRRAGENHGVLVNLQVQYWIEHSGGKIYRSLQELDQMQF